MNLEKVSIANYLSIEDAEIEFRPSCRILVGINESGKTNLLKALSSLGKYMPGKDEVRYHLPKEKPPKESYIRFVFQLDENEKAILCKELESDCLLDINKQIFKDNSMSFKDYVYSFNEGIYKIDVLNQSKNPLYWKRTQNYDILTNYCKPSNSCPATFSLSDGKNLKLNSIKLINTDDYPDIPKDYLEKVDIDYLYDIIGDKVRNLVKENVTEVLYWKYDDKLLLPATINLDGFIGNPDTCLPLKNIFALAGIQDIKTEVVQARQQGINVLRNVLESAAKHATAHFREVWKDHKSIQFMLEPNGTNLDISIKEKNRFTLGQRSDGFKRFITFLLMISVSVRTDKIKNMLILIDEADQSLHPSGARYLRDELLNISKENYVIYSTHSIFMIDGNNISRHIIVKKEEEKTITQNVDTSRIVDEEVIYNALGCSAFEILKEQNIIFEGWRDKHLFNTVLKDNKKIKDKFDKIGLCHAQGVKNIKVITPLLELAQKKCFIISDNDPPALEERERYNESSGYGIWKTYDELVDDDIITSEDFIKNSVFEPFINTLKTKYSLSSGPNLTQKGKLDEIRKWLNRSKISNSNELIDDIKENIFNNLKASHIEESYFSFLNKLVKEIA